MDRTVSGVIAMIPQIVDIRHVEGFRIWLRFKDGREGVMDLSDELWGEVFEPLKDMRYFKKGRLDSCYQWRKD